VHICILPHITAYPHVHPHKFAHPPAGCCAHVCTVRVHHSRVHKDIAISNKRDRLKLKARTCRCSCNYNRVDTQLHRGPTSLRARHPVNTRHGWGVYNCNPQSGHWHAWPYAFDRTYGVCTPAQCPAEMLTGCHSIEVIVIVSMANNGRCTTHLSLLPSTRPKTPPLPCGSKHRSKTFIYSSVHIVDSVA